MYDSVIGKILPVTIRLEDSAGADVTGKVNGDLTVKKADKDDTGLVTVVVGNRSLVELGEGEYTLNIDASVIDTLGFFRSKVSCTGCVTKQYVANVKLANFSDGVVHCDRVNGIAGSTYPTGTRSRPANTVQNALDIADTHKISHVKVNMANDETVAASGNRTKYKTVEGLISPFRKDGAIGALGVSGAPGTWQGMLFKNMRIAGNTLESQGARYEKCSIKDGFTSDDYSVLQSVLEGEVTVSGFADFERSDFLSSDLTISSSAAGDGARLKGCFGKVTIKGMTNANNFVDLDGFFGEIIIDAGNTLGTINIRGGGGIITGAGGGVTVNTDGFFEGLSGVALEASVQAVKAKTDNLPASPANETTSAAIKVKTDKLTFNAANRILSDLREVNDADVTLAELAGLTRDQYVDFFNKTVLARSGDEPSQYKLGTGGNTKTIDVGHVVIGEKKKADTETVL